MNYSLLSDIFAFLFVASMAIGYFGILIFTIKEKEYIFTFLFLGVGCLMISGLFNHLSKLT